MTKIAIYARVSSKIAQDFDRQISDLKRVIQQHKASDSSFDFDIDVEIYAEKISGYKKDIDRVVLNELLSKVYSNPKKYECIYITEISRLGREPKNTREIYDKLTELLVPIYIQSVGQFSVINGERNTTLSIAVQILMEFADVEAKTTKSRMKSGKLEKVLNKGRIHGSNLAYGYMGDENKTLVINPDESIVVEQIFQYYKEGNGTRVIANTLNQLGIPTRLNTTHADKVITFEKTNIEKTGSTVIWDGNTVRQIIKNSIYKGKRKFSGHIVECPAIIDEDLFDYCNELMITKSTRNYTTTFDYLLKDLIRCGCCGRKYYAKYSIPKSDDKVYKCTSTLKNGGSCGNLSMNISLLESVIYDQILNSESLLKYLDNPNDLKKEIESDLKMLEQQLLNESMLIESKENELTTLLSMLLKKQLNPTTTKIYDQKESELTGIIEASQAKTELIKREIISKKFAMSKYDQKSASTEMILGAMHNRPELALIFRQFIDKIIINTLDKKYTLVSVYIKIHGVPLKSTLKLVIFAGGVRAVRHNSRKVYKYLPIIQMENEPEFKDNILIDESNDSISEVQTIIELATQDNFGLIEPAQFEIVPRENWLYITETDL